MGGNLDEPADAVVCWTRDGGATGGTGLGIRVAEKHGIPVLNLHDMTPDRVMEKMGAIARNR